MNISYKTPLQEAISIPVQALAILEDLDAHIKKHRAVFHLSGLQPSISLDSQTSTMRSIDSELSRLYIQHVLKHSPFLSLDSQVQLKTKYLGEEGPQLFTQPDLLADLQKDILALRHKDCDRVLSWLAGAGIGSKRSGGQVLRIHASPDISASQNYPVFKNFHIFENLNLLQAALAYATQDELPSSLVGHRICETWSREYDQGYQLAKAQHPSIQRLWHRRGLMAIKTCSFMCSYFSIHTYRAAPDAIHLTPAASQTLTALMERQEEGSHEAI